MPLIYALSRSGVDILAAVMAGGLIIGVIGHIIRSRVVIVIGILVLGAASVYFAVFVAKVR